MARYNAAYEIHVHGLVPLLPEVGLAQLQDALRPLWQYAGASSLEEGASLTPKSQVFASTPKNTPCKCAGRFPVMTTFVKAWTRCA